MANLQPKLGIRVVLVGAIAYVGFLQLDNLAKNHELLKPYDFSEYWSAGRQLLNGRDAYDPDGLFHWQRMMDAGIRKTVMMWNPPWTLPLTLPFAALPWRWGQFLWIGMQLGAVLLSADLLWRLYGGNIRYRWVSWLIALTFAPTLFLLMIGQISGLLLLGVVGFLWFIRVPCPQDDNRHSPPQTRSNPYLAGVLATLTAIKPHLFVLFALVLLLEATQRRELRKVLATGGVVLLISGLLPLFWNPSIWEQYFAAMRRPPSDTFETMREFEHPTLGYQFRLMLPNQPFEAQFLPLVLGCLLLVPYWYRRRRTWSWKHEMPPLLLVSMLSASYGAWAFDLVILLVPILAIVNSLRESRSWTLLTAAILYLVLNGWVLLTIRQPGSQSNPWIVPTVCMVYLYFEMRRRLIR